MTLLAVLALCSGLQAEPAGPPWAGEWITDLGPMTLAQDGDKVTGRYGGNGEVEGTSEGVQLSFSWKRGRSSGTGTFERAPDGASFRGSWQASGNRGDWRGWKKDPEAEKAKPADFSGVWLSTWGTLQLEQKAGKVTGKYGAQGWSTLGGEVRGRRLILDWKRIEWTGKAWIEQTPDGRRFFGMSEGDKPQAWLGVRLPGFDLHAAPRAGEVVEGRAENGMLYFLRMPKAWKAGRSVDVIVLLHGSNWTTKGMVHVTARNHPGLADRYAVLGIQGEQWASFSDPPDLRFNYTYVNWMGRSTYEGYPYTDRESPYLVAQVLDELKKEYGFGRVFVGGHSQGGFLTYLLHQHFPEKWAGTFPMAGGLVIQAEPDVFKDAALLQAQRAIPMAIVHGTRDDVVEFATGRYCHERFLDHGFPMLRLFAPETGHAFDALPLGDVMEWLDPLGSNDAATLAAFAAKRARSGDWRDVSAAIERAKALKAESRLADVGRQLDEAAKKEAPGHLEAIRRNSDGSWIGAYLAWQDRFEFAPAGRETVEAYRSLQQSHDGPAGKLVEEAQKAFQSGDRDAGWARYEEIVGKHYAAKLYRSVKGWLAERD